MIFSKSVLLIFLFRRAEFHDALTKKFGTRGTRPSDKFLFHDEGALVLLRLGGEAAAQVFDDLVLDEFAAGAPAAGAGELLGAAAQAAKMQHAGRLPEMEPEFVAQAGEEKKFEAVARFAGEEAEVGLADFARTAAGFAGEP